MKITVACFAFAATLVLSGCMQDGATTAAPSAEEAAISGRTLVHDTNTVTINPNGTFAGRLSDGSDMAGTWQIRDGKWCRTLSAPARLAGSACQDLSIEGNQATFTRADGSSITYSIR